jgi:hypothetical protein
MPASAWAIYDAVSEEIGDGTLDMDMIECDMILCLAGSNVSDPALILYSEITNEVPTDFGYIQSGQTCTGTITGANQWLRTGAGTKFDVDDVVWNASGGSIIARYVAIKEHSTGRLLCWSELDAAHADVIATDGNSLTITISGNGVFVLAPA